MSATARTQHIGGWLPALAALVAAAALMPAAADAGCAQDGMRQGRRHESRVTRLTYLTSSGALPLPEHLETALPSRPARPCSGPACSQKSSDLPLPVGASLTMHEAQWANHNKGGPSAVDVECSLADTIPMARASVLGSEIFHPPQQIGC